MLGRLIQTAASYSRGNSTLESATEESHTRNLLYGNSNNAYSLAPSPPTSPYTSPIFRPGSFDDRGGLELEEKDVRILIAQDAGAEDKPTLLFDSQSTLLAARTPGNHVRHASSAGPRSPLPHDWKFQVQASNAGTVPSDSPSRSRGSAIGGGPAPWTRPVRDAATREDTFLECMFGSTSSTKAPSTTKMHILPGRSKSTSRLDGLGKKDVEPSEQQPRRTPLQRSRTSNTLIKSPQLSGSSTASADTQDSVLVTRLFSIPLSETVAPSPRSTEVPNSPSPSPVATPSSSSEFTAAQPQSSKKPKLIERKVPAFAIGVIINLPRIVDPFHASAHPRPLSRSAHAHALSSASSSYGSDMQGSWTFLNAIPETLASSASSVDEFDRRIDTIVNNEDVILRGIALLELEASRVLHQQLQNILNQVVAPEPKTPKEKSMQRINQRIISISDPTAIAKVQTLQLAVKQLVRRVIYALRVPRVVTGLGFGAGHWPDEARTAYRICGRRQQNFFLLTLLTAFLGQHTQWLRRLAPEWYRKQYRSGIHHRDESHALCQRTIIVSDQRAIARRLIFLLASFLPGASGLDGLQKSGEEYVGLNISTSSPSSHITRNESLRRAANRRVRENRLNSSSNERGLLSTSADSGDSIVHVDRARRYMLRKDSDVLSIKELPLLATHEGDNLKIVNSGTTSAVISHPTTPVAVFSTQRGADSDGYFPAFMEDNESVATTGLANILRRSSSSLGNLSSSSSHWSSIVSSLSGVLTHKQYRFGDSASMTAYSSATGSAGRNSTDLRSPKGKPNTLQDMVTQLEGSSHASIKSPKTRFSDYIQASPEDFASPIKQATSAPRLRVDDKDGVVDVDLDIPGFGKFDPEDLFKSPTKSTTKSAPHSVRERAESIRSMRSIPPNVLAGSTCIDTNVAGYLKRHHEDFCLHAVRPYPELEDDIRRSMVAEPAPSEQRARLCQQLGQEWTPVCSTVIADMRTFSVRKLTLKRRLDQTSASTSADSSAAAGSTAAKAARYAVTRHTFVEEEIKDFDAALADAFEKVVDVSDLTQSPTLSPRGEHPKTTSSGATKSSSQTIPGFRTSSYNMMPQDYVRQDCRQVVLGALEDIVKDVCNDLEKLEKGRDIRGTRKLDASGIKEEMKQENILREGVKCWLLNIEQARVF